MTSIELYDFDTGGTVYRYTSGQEVVAFGGETYTPLPLSRSSVSSSATSFVSSLQIETTRNNPLTMAAKSGTIQVKITRPITPVAQIIWQGVVVAVMWSEGGATLQCEDSLTPVQNLTGAQRYTRGCRHVLYSDACGVDIDSVKFPVEVLSSNAAAREVVFFIETPLIIYDYFDGGVFISPTGERYQIISAVVLPIDFLTEWEVTATLAQRVSFPLGSGYFAAPGCNRTRSDCENKLQNIKNFGGFPYITFDRD